MSKQESSSEKRRRSTIRFWKVPLVDGSMTCITRSETMRQLSRKSVALMHCSLMSTFASFLQLSLTYHALERRGNNDTQAFQHYLTAANIVRIVLALSTARFIYLSIGFYKAKLKYDKSRQLVPQHAVLWRTYQLGELLKSSFFCLILPYPFVDEWLEDSTLYIICSSFAVFVQMSSAKRFLYYSYPVHAQDGRLCVAGTLAKFQPDLIVKRVIHDYPIAGGILTLIAFILPASYLFMLIENTTVYDAKWKGLADAESLKPLSSTESMWLMIVTTTTIGYGDVNPQTFIGRVIIATAGLVAVFANALFFSLVVKYFYFTQAELKVFQFLSRATRIIEQKKASVQVIEAFWRNYCAYRNSITWLPSKAIKGMHFRELQQRQVTEVELKQSLSRLKVSEGTLYRDIIDNDGFGAPGSLEAIVLTADCMREDVSRVFKALKHRQRPRRKPVEAAAENTNPWGRPLVKASKEIEDQLLQILKHSNIRPT